MCCGATDANNAVQTVVHVQERVPRVVLPPLANLRVEQGELTDFDLNGGPTEVPIGELVNGADLYSIDFSPCVPLVVFRDDPARTTLKHCFSVLARDHLVEVLRQPGAPLLVVVIARRLDVCRLAYRQKQQHGKTVLEAMARENPQIQFVWREVPTDESMHVRVDGVARTITVSTTAPR